MAAVLLEAPCSLPARCPRCHHDVAFLVEGSDVCIDCDSLLEPHS